MLKTTFSFPRSGVTAIKLSESVSITMLFLSTLEIQQGPGRGLLAGWLALWTGGGRVGQKQRRQPRHQRFSVQVAP